MEAHDMVRKFGIAALAVVATLAVFHGVAFGAGDEDYIPGDSRTSKVNGSISIGPGEHTGDLSTVNGSIHVGDDAVVGHVKTINGSVKIESRATANTLNTVNGSIDVRDGAHVHGSVHAVNGSLHVNNAAEVSGELTNVNGGIHVEGAHVVGSIDTSSGGIDLGPNAHIDGNVVVEKDNSWHFGFWNVPQPPRVVIEPGTVVKGKLHFERDVKLYVSDHATIGAVEGAEVVKFSGDRPPE
jgi:cytoskeletal protein CcmA (bactofilin family)